MPLEVPVSRLLTLLLDSIGQAFCEKGRKALQGYAAYGDVLSTVAERSLVDLRKHMPPDQIRVALGEAAALSETDYDAVLRKMLDGLCRVQSVPFRHELEHYLSQFPLVVRQMFARPSDPRGHSPPEKLDFYKAEQLLPFLPPRRPHFHVGDLPPGLDHWQLRQLRGLGECGEVWLGHDDDQPDHSPAALKFAIDAESKHRFRNSTGLFHNAFTLNDINGIVPLRSVYLETDPPCLEYSFIRGYDLTGLMHEWHWKFPHPKPEAALKLIRRIADVVGRAHVRGIVHRDLKPSNVLVHPTEGGKFTLWITDFGWGQIEAVRSLELHRTGGTPKSEQLRLSLRGAYTPLYASPQQTKNEPPAPTDDVHALGVMWYQLLKRDPHASPPVGEDWADELYPHGFTKSQSKLLAACVAIRPDRRPADAKVLADLLQDELVSVPFVSTTGDGSKIISLTEQGSKLHKPLSTSAAPSSLSDSGNAAVLEKNAGTPKLVRNSLGMTFVPIPAGLFEMGAADDEPGHAREETPRHTVRIARPFSMAIFPVTQGQYEKVMGRNPAFFHPRNGGGPDFPVESMSWYDAEKFCQKLTRFGDEEVYGRTYRLPTEAEWEYACRAGTRTPFCFGQEITSREVHFAAMATKGQGRPCPVGQHPPNAWGLFDMHGNVEEWMQDWFGADYYSDSPGVNPPGPGSGTGKVIRGGDWHGHAEDCRSASRRSQHPDRPLNTVGFRIVMTMAG
jgi:formylglycine-generating enzyme required for sulfatase activity